MPANRTIMLMQCVGSPGHLDDGKFWLAETYFTSDGPRMRVIPSPGTTRGEAEAEMECRQAIIAPPAPQPNRGLTMANLEDAIRKSRNAADASSFGGRCRTAELQGELDRLRKEVP